MPSFRIAWLLFQLIPILSFGQDTSFVNKHNFPTPVRNVFKVKDVVYAKTGDGLYKKAEEGWLLQSKKFVKPYVFYDKDFYQVDFIPDHLMVNVSSMAHLIPQKSITSGTVARAGNKLFVSAGGSLFEYTVIDYYKHQLEDCSIRDIYLEEGLKVVSTYSGIFINDSLKAKEPSYSSGALCKIRGKYYLCNDMLYEYQEEGKFHLITQAENVLSGQFRKLVELGGLVFSQNTKSINQLDSNYNLTPIHHGYEYYDIEVVDSSLLFCTTSGEVFIFDGRKTSLLFNVNTRIRDIYNLRNTIYFSTDKGVYSMQKMQPATLQLVASLPFCVKVIADRFNNVWMATENGLYFLPDKAKEPIPFIPGIEFNRGALAYYKDIIYAGSINGLYTANNYDVMKAFLPQYLASKEIEHQQQIQHWFIGGTILLAALILVAYVYYLNRPKPVMIIPKKEESGLTIHKVEEDIRVNNIMTVEMLAEFYKTNTVQLNRLFKTFDTTPGKFLKKVKLGVAEELLKKGTPIEEVVNRTGYSATYIKKELQL